MNACLNDTFSATRGWVSNGLLLFRQLDTKTRLLLILYSLFIIAVHFGITKDRDDLIFAKFGGDIVFAGIDHFSPSLLVGRYMLWTSRVAIEAVLIPLARLPLFVFNSLNIALLLALPFLLARLFATARDEWSKLLFPAICFIAMYPFSHMGSAGWMATCVNYLWPLAAALVAALLLRKVHDGQPVSADETVFALLCLAFACNNELLCVSFMILLPVYACVSHWNNKRLLLLYATVIAVSLAVILLSPGNAQRFVAEVSTWMPQFYAMSVVQKIYYGYMGFAVPFFFHTNYVLLGANAVLCFGIFQKYTELPFRISAVIPFFAPLLAAPAVIGEQALHATVWEHYVLFFLSLFIIQSLALSIYLLSDTVREYCLVLSVVVAAFCARGALAFSPTMFASGHRTVLYVYAALAIVAVWGYQRTYSTLSPAMLKCCHLLLVAFALLSFVQ